MRTTLTWQSYNLILEFISVCKIRSKVKFAGSTATLRNIISSCLFQNLPRTRTAVLTLKKICAWSIVSLPCALLAFYVPFLAILVFLDIQVWTNIICSGSAKMGKMSSQKAVCCCVTMSAWRNSDTFALNANQVSCQSSLLIPLPRLCHSWFFLLRWFISFRY